MEQEATTPPIILQAGKTLEPEAFATITSALDKKIRWYILVACCLASAAKLLEPPIWVFNPPPDIPFEAAWRNYHIFAAFVSLITVVFLLAGGILGDLYGRRKVLLIGLSGYVAGNLLVMVSPDMTWHIVARSIAIAFGAAAIPLSLAMINITFRDRTMAIAIGIFTICNTLASQIAWAQGEFLAGAVGWRAPYVIPTVVAVLALVAIHHYMPETVSGPRRLLDMVVYAGWTLIILAAFFAVIGWPYDEESRRQVVWIALLLIAGIGLALVIWWWRKTKDHVKVKQRFLLRDLIALIVTGLVLNFVLIAYGVRTYGYFQVALGFSSFEALLAEAPILLGTIVGLVMIMRAVRKQQARHVIAGALLAMALAMVITAWLPTDAPYIAYVIPLFLFGVGDLVAVTVWISAFLRTAVDGYYGLNASINKSTSTLGAAIGAAVAGSLLTTLGMRYFTEAVSHSQVSNSELSTAMAKFNQLLSVDPAYAGTLATDLKDQFASAYTASYGAAYDVILYFVAILCGVTALIIILGLRRSIRAEVATAEAEIEAEIEANARTNSAPAEQVGS